MFSSKWLIHFARNYSKWIPEQKKRVLLSENDYKSFISSLPVIMDKGVLDTKFLQTDELRGRVKRIAEYYMYGRKTIQGEMTILTHEFLRKPQEVKGELLNQQYVLAWCVELAFFSCNVGQYMDAVTSKRKNYNNFTMKHYESIALYKYAYYSSVFPILSALILSNKYNVESRKNVMAIFNDIGVWSQINNDFTDYFDEDTKTGKTGTDIQEGKCTWLAVTVLERCSENQRKIFEESYGSWDPVKIKRIREIYEQTGVIDIYFREEQTTYDRVVEKIKSLPEDTVPSPEFFQTMLDKYYPNVICGKSFKSSN
ncbi:farnesyl pyrophosphate synthase-like isoform X2 [Battus philenor]|uniref:farnesyl pyrophosphate synthase-like isoform X2 n=1 Tax=Battus philenor TaxID=42288 RepID=UPI0035D0A974